MDVTCLCCKEPWDTYHLRHDELFECLPWSEDASIAIRKWNGKLDTPVMGTPARERLADRGWSFGDSLYDVRRCPCCPADAVAHPSRVLNRDMLASLLAGDDDGFISDLQEFEL
jgi:hypothetical protein